MKTSLFAGIQVATVVIAILLSVLTVKIYLSGSEHNWENLELDELDELTENQLFSMIMYPAISKGPKREAFIILDGKKYVIQTVGVDHPVKVNWYKIPEKPMEFADTDSGL
jgi:hypothetical protein